MAKVKVFIWHTLSGDILAIGQPTGAAPCVPVSGANESVVELEVEESHIKGLHETHIVDPEAKALKRRTS